MKEALEKVGNNALGADFLWIQRYYARKLPDEVGRGGGECRQGSFSTSFLLSKRGRVGENPGNEVGLF